VSIRLLVVDPQPFFCEALTMALQRTKDLESARKEARALLG